MLMTFEDVADGIRAFKMNAPTSLSIARKIGRAETYVRRALDEMLALGLVRENAHGVVSLTGERIPFAEVERENDGVAYEVDTQSNTRRAEQLWRARMGTMRWQDDPRAVRERVRREAWSPSSHDRTLGGCVSYGDA